MIERAIYRIINAKLEWFKADSGQRFERFLINELRLEASEAAKGNLYFAGGEDDSGNTIEARPPSIVHGYARTGGPFPCYALTLGSERESQAYLGQDGLVLDDDGFRYLDPETGEIVDPKVRRVEYTFNILVMADNPDVTLWYYHLLKRIILSSAEDFLESDMEVPIVSGADLAPDPRYLPHDIFARQLTLVIEGEECWTEALEGFASIISGIAIDDSGQSETTSGTKALITTYTES